MSDSDASEHYSEFNVNDRKKESMYNKVCVSEDDLIFDSPGDGSCLFHALSELFFNNPNLDNILRQVIVSCENANREDL